MPEYLAPGVYVEETSFRAKAIEGANTSIAGMMGQVDTENCKISEKPRLLASWMDFKNIFGGFSEHNKILAHAIKGFFENGGKRCWVAPLSGTINTCSLQEALHKLSDIDEISLLIMPGITDTSLQEILTDHCHKKRNRFAILDARPTRDIEVNSITGGLTPDLYGAIYFPRILVLDPLTGKNTYIYPSGHIAGVYARVDNNRGVHKAPANETIRGAIDIEFNLSGTAQINLNFAGINVIGKYSNRVLVWGARTLGGDAQGEWKDVNVKRLFIYLEESIRKGTEWVVFEPDNKMLCEKIGHAVSDFLTITWRNGALLGSKPEDAFFVKCDQINHTQQDRAAGRVNIDIGVAVLKPAEFMVFRIVHERKTKS